MLAIKFRRQGKKHQASYRIVVAEKRSKMRGRFVDDLGWFDPHTKKFDLKKEKVEHWMKVGAKPTDSVHNLLVRAEIIEAPKIAVHSTKKKKKKEEPAAEAKAGKEEAKTEPVTEVKEEPASTPVKESKEEEKAEEKPEEKTEEVKKEKEKEKPKEKTESKPEQKAEPEVKEEGEKSKES